ncbi:MAG: hypothetical protein DBY41_01900 [Clostridium sp.]|nr:MAG: hypothetical protein DBY41_01900 [Clostridium sp.]
MFYCRFLSNRSFFLFRLFFAWFFTSRSFFFFWFFLFSFFFFLCKSAIHRFSFNFIPCLVCK